MKLFVILVDEYSSYGPAKIVGICTNPESIDTVFDAFEKDPWGGPVTRNEGALPERPEIDEDDIAQGLEMGELENYEYFKNKIAGKKHRHYIDEQGGITLLWAQECDSDTYDTDLP